MKLNEIRKGKFFDETDCPKCGSRLDYGYKGSQHAKRCVTGECNYQQLGPFYNPDKIRRGVA